MKLKKSLLVVPIFVILTLALLFALEKPSSGLTQQPVHTLLHLNCPPGSHGKPRFTGVGQSLERVREDARASRTLENRAMTRQ